MYSTNIFTKYARSGFHIIITHNSLANIDIMANFDIFIVCKKCPIILVRQMSDYNQASKFTVPYDAVFKYISIIGFAIFS